MHRETKKARGRVGLVLLLAVALVAVFGMAAQQALAAQTFTICAACHDKTATHAKHATVTDCTKCHTNGAAEKPTPSGCASCHGAASIVAKHPAATCGTAGCHVAPVVATIAIDTVVPSNKVVKVKKTIKFSGGVTPVDTAATGVSWVVEMKSGNSWKQVKKGSAKLGFLGGAMRFAYSYKPLKKGSFRTSTSFYNLLGGPKTTSKAILFKAK